MNDSPAPAPVCAYCGKELELVCVYDRLYDDLIKDAFLSCLDCLDLEIYADPPLSPAESEKLQAAMKENQRRSDAYGAASEGEPPAPVLNPREF